ncbi:3-deoxy-D-manno-octulosonic acid transferase [Zavarzinia compransoris]|uniref:3-deoxy-D-manno-octulosonic acid transferase n=1 Tax=Zavarzinia compransoris TaxID=1264899 RepID=A0A317DYE2_9PROT|nr:3-deoxy-D-manno-octulosonic acid transferase [Zavarzinia compransoris]PWR19689.1 3-deoxy-D-manno-octulosonic acid transferase [Zavarzinia compransoris]TDP43365.1 3-deoxy-D-manno-octulosonic-acid transferase [Zavarzinia compransoris]
MTPALYRLLTWAATPLVRPLLERRRRRGKEDAARLGERLGFAGRPRPPGPLVWLHGASVGEAQSVLGLIRALLAARPGLSVLLTTGTVTSAAMMATRLPQGAFHQFVPVDHPLAVRRFLDHWRPDAAVWIESELWPNLVLDTAKRGIPMALVNGRMSAASFEGWRKRPRLIRAMLRGFRFVAAQSAGDGGHFADLGAGDIRLLGNLKLDAPALPADPAVTAQLAAQLGERPRFLAVSTHKGEEGRLAAIHKRIADHIPDLITLIVPRHPERGEEVAAEIRAAGLAVARRQAGEGVGAGTMVYVADTLGELGVFCRLSPLVVMGGSLVPHGGQNPLEPARLGCAVVTGPHMGNFTEVMAGLRQAHAVTETGDDTALTATLLRLLAAPDEVARLGEAARTVATAGEGVVTRVAGAVLALLPGDHARP